MATFDGKKAQLAIPRQHWAAEPSAPCSTTELRVYFCTCQVFELEKIKERVQEMMKGKELCGKKDLPDCPASLA